MDFSDAADFISQMRDDNLAKSVTYRRGLATLEDLEATAAPPQADNDGEVARFDEGLERRDWIVTVANLELDDAATLPADGDEIVETAGGKTYTWRVAALDAEPCYRYCEDLRVSLRIHTVLINEE